MGDIKEDMSVADLAKILLGQFEQQNAEIREMKAYMRNDITNVNLRLNKIDRKPFDPDRTVCITGLKPKPGVSDQDYLDEIFSSVGGGCTIINTKRMNPYGLELMATNLVY